MRPGLLALSVAVTTAACMNRGVPADTSPEIRPRAGAAVAPASLRLVTYNVHDEPGGAIAAALRGSAALAGADLVVMQEVRAHGGCSAACAAARELGMSSVYAPGHLEGPGSEGVAIMSRWPLRDVEVIELPREHVVFNSGRRAAVAATVDTEAGPLRVFAVHLDNRVNPAARVRQLRPVLAAAAAHDGPALVAGDVNTNPFLWIGHVVPVPAGVQHRRLEAAVRAAGLDTPVTGSGPTHQWLSMRLDAIYSRGLRVPRYGVEQAVRISDHLPLWAVVEIADATADRR
ncbi:MAG TPA: endonuclease/exonuclease/phosphatase family protein [Kofleriaceae bacterium]|nr:endonuclease/exonuclease/phosphatase family protein [Kofleriaceae bacterium]